jgi:hypothetical protein
MLRKLDNRLLNIAAVLLLLLLFSSVVTAQPPAKESTRVFLPRVTAFGSTQQQSNALGNDATEPIAFVGHGAIFDQDGKEVTVTLEFIEDAQAYYLDALYQQANEDQRTHFKEKRNQLFQGRQWDKQSELFATAALLDWLIEEVKLADAGALASKNNLMWRLLRSKPLQPEQTVLGYGGEPFSPLPELTALLAEVGLAGPSVSAAGQLGGADYIQQCTAAGVPIPPDWGTNRWISKGTLSDAEEFISQGLEAEVYVYDSNSPEGLCIALPRSAGNSIELLGIICLGKTSSNACFWDNQEDDVGYSIPKGTVVPLTDFAGGPELLGGSGQVCTDCHAGENPFVIHPNTNLGLPRLNGLDLFADNWYQPLVHPDWPQNLGPSKLLDNVPSAGSCTTCHTQTGGGGRFPEPSTDTPNYCSAILSEARNRTMPPSNPGNASYAPHVNALLAACNNPPGLACDGSIYVDAAYSGVEKGTQSQPFRTVSAAYDYACPGATLRIKAGSYPERLNMWIDITLISEGGTATIGP